MLDSPYFPGSNPGYLAGRGGELDLIQRRLARMRMLGRSGGPLLAFHGPRGLGKTSLLRRAKRDATDAGYLTVMVEGHPDLDLAPTLARELSTAIQRNSSFGDRAKTLLHSLDKVQVELGVAGAKVGLGFERSGTNSGAGQQAVQAVQGSSDGVVDSAVRTMLEDAGQFARNHDHGGLAVFVDEFQNAPAKANGSLLRALQAFDDLDPGGVPVAVIAAGLPETIYAAPAAATYGERTKFVEVNLLNDVAVAEALRLPAEQLGVSWTDEAILAAVDHVRGYPHRAQLLGEGAWEAARPGPGGTIVLGHVRAGVEYSEQGMATLFRSRLGNVTTKQREFVSAMAQLGDGPVARADIAFNLGSTSTAISDLRNQLVNRGLIASAGYGRVEFTIPGFAAFVRASDLEERGPLPGHGPLGAALPPMSLDPAREATTPPALEPPNTPSPRRTDHDPDRGPARGL